MSNADVVGLLTAIRERQDAEIAALKAALQEALEIAEGLPQINDWGPDPVRIAELRRLLVDATDRLLTGE